MELKLKRSRRSAPKKKKTLAGVNAGAGGQRNEGFGQQKSRCGLKFWLLEKIKKRRQTERFEPVRRRCCCSWSHQRTAGFVSTETNQMKFNALNKTVFEFFFLFFWELCQFYTGLFVLGDKFRLVLVLEEFVLPLVYCVFAFELILLLLYLVNFLLILEVVACCYV